MSPRTAKRKRTPQRSTRRKPATRPAAEQAPAPPAPPADGLTDAQRKFALSYLENGFNATQAYKDSHPDITQETAEVNGCRALRNAKVRAFLNPLLEAAWQPLQMGGEQALARVALLASDDPDSRVKLAALKVILEQSGKLKTIPDSIDALAAAIRADQEAHKSA